MTKKTKKKAFKKIHEISGAKFLESKQQIHTWNSFLSKKK